MPEQYPQGLKKNPIRVYSPTNKQVMQFNSYREAMDNYDKMVSLSNKEYRKPEGSGGAYKAENDKAKTEGFKNADSVAMGPYTSKAFAVKDAMQQHNSNFMAKTAAKKPAYNGQSTMSKLMDVKNLKRK